MSATTRAARFTSAGFLGSKLSLVSPAPTFRIPIVPLIFAGPLVGVGSLRGVGALPFFGSLAMLGALSHNGPLRYSGALIATGSLRFSGAFAAPGSLFQSVSLWLHASSLSLVIGKA